MRHVVLVSFLVLAACGGNGSNPGDDQPDADAGQPDADDAWTPLIGRSWNVPAGVFDVYRCTRIMITEDTYIAGFRSQAPLGSHHAVLTTSTTNPGQLGDYDCGVQTVDYHMLYASGVGTDDLVFPDGVGVFVPAGTFLHLNLHLFNSGEAEITGDSAVMIKRLPAAPPTLADMTFAGDMALNIPADSVGHVEEGGCTLSRDYTVLALWPHMHQLATHQTIEIIRDGTTTPVVLLDEDYSFSNQTNWLQDPPLAFNAGDRVNVRCTYDNPTGSDVHWGDSSTEEMCFAGLYRYPASATANLFECVTQF